MNVRVALAACLLCCAQARAAADFVVQTTPAADEKAVFATVESTETVPARVRTAGTSTSHPKLVLQEAGLRDEIAALHAQLAQTKADLQRSETLVLTGATPRMLRDQLRTQVQVQQNTIQARMAQLQVVAQQMTEGQVLAPTSGRVLDLPYTEGTVVTAGESVASIAVSGYVLRLRVPEEHARFIKPGDQIRVDDAALPGGGSATGRITLVYPQIKDGRVVAEAQVAGLGAYFVGQRVLVWVAGGVRPRVVVPANLLVTRFGLDYARLVAPGGIVEVPVQRGQPANLPNMPDGIEILSGLCAGDRLAPP